MHNAILQNTKSNGLYVATVFKAMWTRSDSIITMTKAIEINARTQSKSESKWDIPMYRYYWNVFSIKFGSCYVLIWSQFPIFCRCTKTLTEDHATITDTKMRINRKVPTLDAQFVVFHRYVFCTHYHDQWDRHHPYKIHLQSQSACLPAFLPALLCNMDVACVCIWFYLIFFQLPFQFGCPEKPKIHILCIHTDWTVAQSICSHIS